MKVVTKQWLERRIRRLNIWLNENDKKHLKYALKKHNRDYYVQKLIKLEEFGLEKITV